MSRHEYDYEDELDDSLGITSRTHIGTKAWIEAMEHEQKRAKARVVGYDLLSDSRRYRWRASILEGAAIEGQIVIPEECDGDQATMRAFEIIFGSVEVKHQGLGLFEATLEGRLLGRFRLPEYERVEVDVFGRPRHGYDTPSHLQSGIGWLRQNLKFQLFDGKETFPPYEPALPKKPKGVSVTQAAMSWSQKLATAKKPEDAWVPLNEGQDVSSGGVNLSASSGGGATNMAFSTQMGQTAVMGLKATSKDPRATPVVQMHLEGKVIG